MAWDPSPDTNVVGYILYYGTSSGTYTTRLNVGTNTTAVVSGLNEGQTYFFVVTAYNAQALESGPSNEVSFIVPGLIRVASTSMPLRVTFPVAPGHNYQIQATSDLRSWLTIWQTNCPTNCWVTFADPQAASLPTRFYRLYFQP